MQRSQHVGVGDDLGRDVEPGVGQPAELRGRDADHADVVVGLERAGGEQRGQRGTRVGHRVGGGREQGEVLGQRTGGERRLRPRRRGVQHVAPAVDEPAEDRPPDHVEDRVARQAERVTTSEGPAQRGQRVAEHAVGDELEPGGLGRAAEDQRLAQQAQHLVDLGGRLAAGEDRQPAGGDGRRRPHDGRVQVRRPGRRHQGVQRLRLVRSDRGGVDDGRPGGQRGQDRGEHVAAGRAVVQAEQHHLGAFDGDGG